MFMWEIEDGDIKFATKPKLKVYVCHEFGGKRKNYRKVKRLIRQLSKQYSDVIFLSPILYTDKLYNTLSYDEGMHICYSFLEICDAMLVLGPLSASKGCKLEKEFVKNNNNIKGLRIQTIDKLNFDKWYKFNK